MMADTFLENILTSGDTEAPQDLKNVSLFNVQEGTTRFYLLHSIS